MLERFAAVIVGHPRLVLMAWVVAVLAAAPFAASLSSVLDKQGASKIVDGTPSALAQRLVDGAFAQGTDRDTSVVISAADVRSAGVRRLLARLDEAVALRIARREVAATSSPFTLRRDAVLAAAASGRPVPAAVRAVAAAPTPAQRRDLATRIAAGTDWRRFPVPVPDAALARVESLDGHLAVATVSFALRGGADPDVAWLRATAKRLVRQLAPGDVHVQVTGELALIHDTYARAEADNGRMEAVAYVIVALVLILFFRAVLPAILTLLAIGLAMTVSQAALFALGHSVHLTQFTVTIMTFVMLGAGVDYSMLLSSRYRQERLRGGSVEQAVIAATAHAGHSIVLAGSAVMLAFGATLLSPVDWIPPLGFGGLLGIPIILFAALTITPSLLILLGDRFFSWGWSPLADLENGSAGGRMLGRVAAFTQRRKVAVTMIFLVATAPFVWLAVTHSSTSDPVALSPRTDSRAGFERLAGEYGKASLFPTTVVGRLDPGLARGGRLTARGHNVLDRLTDRLAAVEGVAGVDSVVRPYGSPLSPAQARALAHDVRAAYLSPGGVTRMVVRLRGDPFSAAARATTHRVQRVVAAERSSAGDLVVGGSTAIDEQYAAGLRDSFLRMVAVVTLGIFVVLLWALRSLLVPIRLIATIMLSNLVAIGITVIVFAVWRDAAIIDDLPIFLIVLMMGLGMDYEIFLLTRVRELRLTGIGDEQATIRAVVDTGRVITAAGLVMAGCLGALTLSSTLMLQQYGVGLGAAVLFDATLVRLLLVPATLTLLGRWNWWLPRLPVTLRPSIAGTSRR